MGICAVLCPSTCRAFHSRDCGAGWGCGGQRVGLHGVCVDKCAQGALSLVREASKGKPLEIESLMACAVDVGAEAKSQKG
jgi:hypothetical protein